MIISAVAAVSLPVLAAGTGAGVEDVVVPAAHATGTGTVVVVLVAWAFPNGITVIHVPDDCVIVSVTNASSLTPSPGAAVGCPRLGLMDVMKVVSVAAMIFLWRDSNLITPTRKALSTSTVSSSFTSTWRGEP